ncbi:MAG: polysaccharide biosynthesis C-terminal domain-containing protein [Phycisphaerales bacterium]|nr:MAG: polysaccharide biosynthesis C-terminal domain-containing protein [Phycisphaerales bacterium]
MLRRIAQELKQGKILLEFGFFKGTGQALGMIAPLVVAKFLSSAESFGSYCLAKMILFFFTSILVTSAQAPFVVFANQERTQTQKINKSFSVQFVLFILGFVVFFAITIPLNKYLTIFAKIGGRDLPFVLLAYVGLALKIFLCNLFMSLGQRIKNSLVELTFGAATLSVVFGLYFTGMLSLRTVFLAYLASGLLVVAMFIGTIDFRQLTPFGIDKKHCKEMFDFTKWLMLGATAVYFINWGGNLVLRLFVSTGYISLSDIGTYNLGYQIFKGIIMLTFVVNTYFLPFVSEHIENTDKIRSYLFNKKPKILLVGLIVIVAVYFVFPYVRRMVYGDVYQDSVTLLRILLIGPMLMLYSVFYETLLLAVKKYRFTQCIYVLQVFLNLFLTFLLVPVMGLPGAAVATVVAYFCRAVTIEIYFRIKLQKLLGL